MKKYTKPAIEEIKIGVQYPINSSQMSATPEIGTGESAPGRKYKDDEDDFDEGW